MSQALLHDPLVLTGPIRTGTGTGSLTVDKLTHFTTAQSYTATCIAKSPSTIFSVVGSTDGPVGIATAGTQFFDDNLKIFLTIQQQGTPFEVGDQFTFSVGNGSDLNQDNIDAYDEQPQKNFGAGIKGFLKGDHNLRYSNTALKAYRYIQGVKYEAVTPGSAGNGITVAYVPGTAAVPASLVMGDLTLTAKVPGVGGNAINITETNYVAATTANLTIQDILWESGPHGSIANTMTVQYTTGAPTSTPVIGLSADHYHITVQIQSGVTTANQIIAAVTADVRFQGTGVLFHDHPRLAPGGVGTNTQTAPVGPLNFSGGVDSTADVGNEVVTVVGNAITIQFHNGVATATNLQTALQNSAAASALISVAITGTASNPQTSSTNSAQFLTGGVNSFGFAGTESVTVVGNAITVHCESGKSTATAVAAAVNAFAAASALVTATVVGLGINAQECPFAAVNLLGGLNKTFAVNHNELTDAGNFFEGNANVKMQDALVQGRAEISGHAQVGGPLALNDTNAENDSGTAIANVQKYINRLLTERQIQVDTADASPIRWQGNQIFFSANLEIWFRDSGILNTIAAAQSPISVPDGSSLYVTLNPAAASTLPPFVATTVPADLHTFRVATSVAGKLIWFNGVISSAGDIFRIGSTIDYRLQQMSIITDGGVLTSDSTIIGKITWSNTLNFKVMGMSAVLSIPANNVTLNDGDVAYIQLPDPLVSGSVTMLTQPYSATDMLRPDRYWIFHRAGSVIHTRNGASLDPGESRTIAESIGNATFSFIGATGDADSTPSYTTGGHTTGATANRYVVDADNLSLGIKKLDIRLGQVNDIEAQDRTLALIGGGTWTWDGTNLTWSAAAYISIPGLADTVNNIPAGTIAPALDDLIYVTLNRSGAGGNLTVSHGPVSSTPLTDNLYVIARRPASGTFINIRDMILQINESKPLRAGMSDQNRAFAGMQSEADNAPAYTTSNGPTTANTYIADGDSLSKAIKKHDTELARHEASVTEHGATGAVMGTTNAQTVSNKKFTDGTNTFVGDEDPTMVLGFEIEGATGVTTTIRTNSTVNRTLDMPDASTTLVGIDVAQVITNKDIDGGTAANNRRITIPKDTYANLLLLARKQGTILFATDNAIMYVDDGTTLHPIGSGGGLEPVTALDSVDTALPASYTGNAGSLAQRTVNTQIQVAYGYASSSYYALAQQVVVGGATTLTQCIINFYNGTGGWQFGAITLKLIKDVSGAPSNVAGDVVATSSNSTPNNVNGDFAFTFPANTNVGPGTYWLVVMLNNVTTQNYGPFGLNASTSPTSTTNLGFVKYQTVNAGAWTTYSPNCYLDFSLQWTGAPIADGYFLQNNDTVLFTNILTEISGSANLGGVGGFVWDLRGLWGNLIPFWSGTDYRISIRRNTNLALDTYRITPNVVGLGLLYEFNTNNSYPFHNAYVQGHLVNWITTNAPNVTIVSQSTYGDFQMLLNPTWDILLPAAAPGRADHVYKANIDVWTTFTLNATGSGDGLNIDSDLYFNNVPGNIPAEIANYVAHYSANPAFIVTSPAPNQFKLRRVDGAVPSHGVAGAWTITDPSLAWQLQTSGQSVSGDPVAGDACYVKFGTNYANLFYTYDGVIRQWYDYDARHNVNKFLSNLVAPTAINQDLLPAANNSTSLGSDTLRWATAYGETLKCHVLTSYGNGGNGGPTDSLSIVTQNSGGTYTGSITLQTGIQNGGQPSGSIYLTTGAGNGPRGDVQMSASDLLLNVAFVTNNGTMRYASGSTRYAEEYYVELVLTGNATTTPAALTFDSTVFKGFHLDYVIVDTVTFERRTGTIKCAVNAASGAPSTAGTIVDTNAETAALGITWQLSFSGNNVIMQAVCATANNKNMNVTVKRYLG